jgi:hypothetical protein
VVLELGLGIKCCEVALSSASAATWDRKIKNAQRVHDIAQLSGFPDTRLIVSIIESST